MNVKFTDVTEKAGIHFKHNNGATGRKLLPETMGSGIVAFDYNADGLPDLLFINGCTWTGTGPQSLPALYRNNGNGTFTDVTAESGLAVELYGMGVTAGDYDNDGFPDLFITAVGGNRLFHNEAGPNGQRRFVDVTESSGVSPSGKQTLPRGVDFYSRKDEIPFPSTATWLDFDGDGKLDLFVCYYVTWSPAFDLQVDAVLSNGARAYVPPTQFPGAYCQLFRNVDGKRFEDVSESAGIRVSETQGETGPRVAVGKSLGVVECDFDKDGWPDLIVANDTVRNFYFHNVPDQNGGRKFEEIGMSSGVAYAVGPRGGMGIDTGEIRPGQDAFVIANFSNESDTLMALTTPTRLLFQDRAMAEGISGPSRGPMKFAALFFDFDLDGNLDLFTANGHLEPDIAAVQSGQTHAQQAQLYRNLGTSGGPLFQMMTEKEVGPDLFQPCVGRGAAVLDFNGDGAPDLVVAVNGGKAKLFENRNTTKNRWIRLTLNGDGVTSNRDAIGADVIIEAGGREYHRNVIASRGYLSQSELTITCGLGSTTKVDRIRVRWPGKNAKEQSWTNLETNRGWVLKQGIPEAQQRD